MHTAQLGRKVAILRCLKERISTISVWSTTQTQSVTSDLKHKNSSDPYVRHQ